jgi:hypothetical protein
MAGIYLIDFASPVEAERFVARYENCPVWPVVTQGMESHHVFILAVELKYQQHGDFSQEGNTLVLHPEYLGAREVRFKRDDGLLDLFTGHQLTTGYADKILYGANCESCPSYHKPCWGCPAYYSY